MQNIKIDQDLSDIHVIDDKILVKVIKEEPKSSSGLIILQNQDNVQKAVVVKIGPGKWNDEETKRLSLDIRVNDVIIIKNNVGIECSINGEKFVSLVNEDDILGIIGEVDLDGNIVNFE